MNTKPTIIDVREPEEYISGHVDGAINIPLSVFSQEKLANLKYDDNVIVYCRSGQRAGTVVGYMKELGYKNVVNGINQRTVEANLVLPN